MEDFLTDEEKDIVRRGRNSHPHSTAKNADVIEYKYATGFEALIGYLYLQGQEERLQEIFRLPRLKLLITICQLYQISCIQHRSSSIIHIAD